MCSSDLGGHSVTMHIERTTDWSASGMSSPARPAHSNPTQYVLILEQIDDLSHAVLEAAGYGATVVRTYLGPRAQAIYAEDNVHSVI